MSDAIAPPRLRAEAIVAYPEGARGAGEVVLDLEIDASGSVAEVAVVRGDARFMDAARDAAQAWQFEPAMRGGRPLAARIRFTVRFTEPSAEPRGPAAAAPSPLRVERAEIDPHAQVDPRTEVDPRIPAGSSALAPIDVTVAGRHPDRLAAFSRAEVRQLPGAFGDPFRAVEAMPGVTPVASGLPYFYVRGAPPGNVGYFFDGIRVPVLFHLAAGPSVVHPSFVEGVKLYSGAYPARFGRFAGGIVTADAVEPADRWRGEASIRLVDAGAMVEAPFDGNRGNVMLAGRYSYTGAVVSLISPDVDLGYWDYQARAGYDLTPRDRIGLFAFGSFDAARQEEGGAKKTVYDTRFHRVDARYERRLSAGGRLRIAATVGDDRTLGESDAFVVRDRMVAGRVEYAGRPSAGVELRAGADVQFDRYRFDVEARNGDTPDLSSHDDVVAGARIDAVIDLGDRVSLVPGVRFDGYRAQGRTVAAVEPRAGGRFRVSEDVTLFNDFGVAHQLPSYVVPIPGVQPDLGEGLQRSFQSSAGVEAKLPRDWTGSLTIFQNVLLRGTDRLGIASLRPSGSAIVESARSTGHAYGVEVMVKRSLTKRLGGFVAYTLARSVRRLPGIEGPSAADRTHVLNVAVGYDLGRGWRAGSRVVFYSGVPAKVGYADVAREPPRTPPFFRLDWRIEKRWQTGGGASWALVLEFLNTTLSREVLRMSCAAYGCKRETLGPISIPSVGVEASF